MNSPYTYARISTRAITRNLGLIRKHLSRSGHGRTAVMAVVKSDAYGHGMIPVSLALERAGIDALGVAFVHEGALLRDAGKIFVTPVDEAVRIRTGETGENAI